MSATRPSTSHGAEAGPLIPEKVLRFMNALPTTGESLAWILQFRAALGELLGDVDRIAVQINIHCDILHPKSYRRGIEITLFPDAERHLLAQITCDSKIQITPADRLIAKLKGLGHPIHEYQRPYAEDYYLADRDYLATILLFRKRRRPPISALTLKLMRELHPFLLFVFSGFVTRHKAARPVDLFFVEAYEQAVGAAGLSTREGEVTLLHLFGLSYVEIARRLFISKDTVAKHVKSAHRKTNCASFLELFAPYFREAREEVTDGEG